MGALGCSDHLDESLRIADEAIARDRERGSVAAHAMGCFARAWPALCSGRVAEAAADARTALEIWQYGSATYLPAATFWLVCSLVEQDDLDGAADALARLAAQQWAARPLGSFVHAAHGVLHAARGDHRAALAAWLSCGAHAGEWTDIANPSVLPWHAHAAISAARLGEPGADALAAEAVRRSTRFGAPRALSQALLAASVAAGNTARGLEFAHASARATADSPARLAQARSRLHLGAMLRRRGDRPQARRELEAAQLVAEQCGATAIARQAADELAMAGGRTRRASAGELRTELTVSESRVAELAAQGLTNREIARALFVTVKAVEWHLSNVYRKLGVRRRGGLARALADASQG